MSTRLRFFPIVILIFRLLSTAHGSAFSSMVFEENVGQAPSSVRLLTRSEAINAFFTVEGVAMALQHNRKLLQISFLRTEAVEVHGEEQLEGTSNYLVGNRSQWHSGIRHFAKVHYRNLYPGVDASFYGRQTQLEFDLIVQPGADLKRIALRIEGTRGIKLRDGDLILQLDSGELHCKKPLTYQVLNGVRRLIDTQYEVEGTTVHFRAGRYDRGAALIIDPIFDYATYLGGSGSEWAYSVATDNMGAIYAAGVTQSTNFPVTAGMQRNFAGGLGDVFVTKFKPDSSGVQYSTYIGGSGSDGDMQGYVGGIAVDDFGNVYIAGVTRSADFPATPNAFQPIFATRDTCGSGPSGGPCGDAFILKLNPSGTALVYSSFLGGGNHDEAKALALDASGDAYVTGITSSSDFPTTSNAFQRVLQYQDAFLAKISPDGSHLIYSTLLGGSGYDLSLAIAVDSAGRAHVAGMTESNDFPVKNAFDSELDPPWDAFVTKLSSDGSSLEFSTLLGGAGTQQVLGIALDTTGHIYLAGYTDSSDFPVVNAFQPDYGGGGGNGFVTKLPGDGSAILYSTFLGGQDAISELDAIYVNSHGEAYVAGSGGSDFPVVNSARPYSGAADAVLAKLTADGSGVYYSTFFGGNGYDLASSLTIDSTGFPIIGGETASANMPTHWAAPQRAFGGATDAFVARFQEPAVDAPTLSAPKLINVGTAYVGVPSFPKSLRISNTGNRPLNITRISASDNVKVASTCSVLEPAGICSLSATITLPSTSPGVGTITVYDDAPDSPQTLTVRGTGIYGGDLELVSLTAGAPFFSSGALTVPFTAVVRNNGPYLADSVTLRVSNNIGGSDCAPCSIGALASGQTTTVRFNRISATYGMLPVVATVFAGSHTPDINSANDSQTVNVAIPTYSATPAFLDFSAQAVNSQSSPQRITFFGVGAGPFRLSFSVGGDFRQTNNCGAANDDGCHADITFAPTAADQRTGTLTVYETLAGTTQTIPLSGSGVLAPYVTFSSSALDLGTRMIGRTSPQKTLTLTNSGSAALQIVSIGASGEFAQSHNCPSSLPMGANCTVSVSFTPLATGTRTGYLTIQDNASGNPHRILLSGIGANSPVVISPPALDFGMQRLGTTSIAQLTELTNVGGTSIHLSNIVTPSGFQQTNDCTTILPDTTCRIAITFTPTTMTTAGGTLTIQDDGFGSPRSVALTGTGVQPVFGVDRPSLAFPSTRVNSTSPTQFVTLVNTGNSSMTLSSISASGDFSITNGCGYGISANGNCYVVVSFRPTAVGTRTGEITINDDATGSPHRVALSGSGRAQQVNLLPSALTFSTQAVGTRSASQTVTIYNDTGSAVAINSIGIGTDFSQTNDCPQQLASDATCTVNISYAPTAPGSRNGNLTIVDSTGTHVALLAGVGASSAAALSPTSLTFLPVQVGGSSSLAITLSSTGSAPLNLGKISISGLGYSYESSCPTALSVGRSCSITVRFRPVSIGVVQGALVLTDDAPGSPRTVSLSGTGFNLAVFLQRPGRTARNTSVLKPSEPRVSTSAATRFTPTITWAAPPLFFGKANDPVAADDDSANKGKRKTGRSSKKKSPKPAAEHNLSTKNQK